MAIKLFEEGGIANSPNKVFITDSISDLQIIQNLPFGTIALNLEDGYYYCLNSSGEWKKLNNYQ